MVDSIAKTLGSGSGIDIGALVTSLVDAQYAAKATALAKREETLTAQLSAVSKLKSGITGFSSALQTLVRGGSLATSVGSANAAVVKATALPGANVAGLSTSVEVRALATAQVASTTSAIPAATTFGAGALSIRFGSYDGAGAFQPDATTPPDIAIDAADTLAAIAAKITAAGQGVTASVITDGDGQRLVMKGATGAARAFTITAATGSDPALAALEVGPGKTGTAIATPAADARVAIDGVEVRRASNTVADLIPGVSLSLQSAQPGTRITIGSTPPTDALRQAVSDVAATYNELLALVKEDTDPVSGTLARDTAARDMGRSLAKLTLTDLTGRTDGAPRTLAEIGVTTNRDGTLSVDTAKLDKALARNPAAIEAMFADGKGLPAALSAIAARATGAATGLGASESRYAKAQASLATDRTRADAARTATQTRLTQQYASMDARVAAYKSTQAFMTQQIASWNASNS